MSEAMKENDIFSLGTSTVISTEKRVIGYTIILTSGKEIVVKTKEDLERTICSKLQDCDVVSNIKPIVDLCIENNVGDYAIKESKFGYTTRDENPFAMVWLDFVTKNIDTDDKIILHFMMDITCNRQSDGRVFLDLIVKAIGDADPRYPSINIDNVSIIFNSKKKIDEHPELLKSFLFVEALFGHYLSMCESLNHLDVS